MASILAVSYVQGQIDGPTGLRALIQTMYAAAAKHGASIYLSCAMVYMSGMLCASDNPDDLGRCVATGSG
jgi:hypothetical protein